jgi:Flp pilus assembly secretin CpaC
VLDGEVATAEEARRAAEIAAIYAPKVVNQLSVRGQMSPEAGAATQLRELINLPNVNVRVSGDTAILTGTVDSPQQAQDADTIARTASKNVINLLKLPALSVDQLRESLGAGSDAVIGSATAGPLSPGTFAAPAPLTVRQAGGSLILEGTVSSPAALDQVLAQASRTGLPLLNRLQVPAAATPDQGLLSAVAASIGRPGIRVSGTAKRLILEGVVPDTEAAVAVEQIARAYSTQVDNLLQTPNPRLVDVDVSIVEITKTGLKNLGFTYPSLLDGSASGYVLGQRSTSFDLPGPLPVAGTGALTAQTAFQAALRAEITNSDARLLSNPRTTVLSGRTATFQVGGQVPVPVSITQSATGTITGIAFKDFGVLVDVVPNASANGAVTMRVKTEISQPDRSIGFTPFAGASIIPGFTRRAAVTEVTTPAGGTVALGGLISNTNRQIITKVPVLGSLPILGSLFTSKRFQNDQTELVIFVTPRVLPNPLIPGTTAAAGVVAVGNTSNIGTVLGNPGLATGGIAGTTGTAP